MSAADGRGAPTLPAFRPRGGRPGGGIRRLGKRMSERGVSPDGLLIPLLIVLGDVVLSANLEEERASYAIPVAFGVVIALIFEFARRQGLIWGALLVLVYNFAFIPGSAGASVVGLSRQSMPVSGDSVTLALMMLAFFLAVIVVSAKLMDVALSQWIGSRWGTGSEAYRRRGMVALTILVGIAVVYCLGTGTWTSYGGKASETAAINSVKLDMVYDPLLLAGFSVAVDQFIRHEERRTQWRGRWGSIAGILVVGLLLFTRQGRRQMVAALLIAGLQVIFNPILWARIRRSTLRLGALGVVALAFGAIVNFGSLAWRKSSAEFQTNSMAERLGDTMHRVNMIDAHDMSTVRERFTYLWLDAATIQYDSLVGGSLLLTDMFRDSVVAAIPKVLFPDKVEYGLVECEQAFERIDVWADLPCTPSAEGFMTNGLAGVVLVATGFGVIAGLASYLTRRRTVFCLAAGAELVQGLTLIECSAFPWTFAIRSAVFSTVCVVLISWVLLQLPSSVSNRGRTRPAAA